MYLGQGDIVIDVRNSGYGMVYKNRAEILTLELEEFLLKLSSELSALTAIRDPRTQVLPQTLPKSGFPDRFVQIECNHQSFNIHKGYWTQDGSIAFGGISEIWGLSVDQVIAVTRVLLQYLQASEYKEWTGRIIWAPRCPSILECFSR
jgi:hypothetical protein